MRTSVDEKKPKKGSQLPGASLVRRRDGTDMLELASVLYGRLGSRRKKKQHADVGRNQLFVKTGGVINPG